MFLALFTVNICLGFLEGFLRRGKLSDHCMEIHISFFNSIHFQTESQNKNDTPVNLDFCLFCNFFFASTCNLTFRLQRKKETATIDGADKEILAEAERLDVKAMGPLILSELLFNENIRDQIKKYKRHFLRVSWHQICCCCPQ